MLFNSSALKMKACSLSANLHKLWQLKSTHIYRHISPLNKSSHLCSRKPCGFKLMQKCICLRGFYCKQQSSGGLRIEKYLLH